MNFPLKIVDACCKVREKFYKPELIIGYLFSPELIFEPGIIMAETNQFIKALVEKPIQHIYISLEQFFQTNIRGDRTGIERLKVNHELKKGKVALIWVKGLKTIQDFIEAINLGLNEFITAGIASMMNRDLLILLKENKGDKL